MNILLEGVYRLVLKINEEKIEGAEVPINLEINKNMIGIRNFDETKVTYTPDDIIIRDPSVVLKYDASIT